MSSASAPGAGCPSGGPLLPTAVGDLELSHPVIDLSPPSGPVPWGRVRLLVRAHGVPLGEVVLDLRDGAVTAERLRAAVTEEFGLLVRQHAEHDGVRAMALNDPALLEPLELPPCSWVAQRCSLAPASVVITTVGTRPELAACVDAVLAQTFPACEVLVVDNGATSSVGVRELVSRASGSVPVRYVHEPRRGLSHARNAGLAVAQGAVVAFTDDDVVVDGDWLGWLCAALDPAYGVVVSSGLILPTHLESPAQLLFEQFGGYSKGFVPHVLDASPDPDDSLHPYRLGRYGSGASNAFLTEVLRALGGFDTRLGAGTPTAGGEDLDLFLRVVLAGHAVAYEPRALLRHPNHAGADALAKQMHGYGRGLGAVLAKHLVEGGAVRRREMLTRVGVGTRHMMSRKSVKNERRDSDYPRRLVLLELAGLARGALDFVRTRAWV